MDGKISEWIKNHSYHHNWMRLNANSCTLLTQICVDSLGWTGVGARKGRWVSGCLACSCKYSTTHTSMSRYQLTPNVNRKPNGDSEHLLKVGCKTIRNKWQNTSVSPPFLPDSMVLTMALPWVEDSSARLMALSHILIPSCSAEFESPLNYSTNLLEQGPQYLLNHYLFHHHHHDHHHYYSMDSMDWRSCLPNKLQLSSDTCS